VPLYVVETSLGEHFLFLKRTGEGLMIAFLNAEPTASGTSSSIVYFFCQLYCIQRHFGMDMGEVLLNVMIDKTEEVMPSSWVVPNPDPTWRKRFNSCQAIGDSFKFLGHG
jgi:hypothetical protein